MSDLQVVGYNEQFSTDKLVEPCTIALTAVVGGMSEHLLSQLVADRPPSARKLRNALRRAGAVERWDGWWVLGDQEALVKAPPA